MKVTPSAQSLGNLTVGSECATCVGGSTGTDPARFQDYARKGTSCQAGPTSEPMGPGATADLNGDAGCKSLR